MRVDLYTFVHKAQRFHLFRLSEVMGMTDFSNSLEAEEIANKTLHLMEHIKDHAQNEKNYIHPLFQAIGAVGNHFDNEHTELDKYIEKIEAIVAEKRWSELYSTYTKFIGTYLLHLDEEEAAQRDVLWQSYEDKDLAAVFNRFKVERPPHLSKADLEFMLPALSIPELTQMFRGIKASAPDNAFQGACNMASRVLEPNKWKKIVAALIDQV